MLALLAEWRTGSGGERLRAYPTLRRLELLLTSRLWEPERDARIWQDGAGQPAGFAALWSRERDDAYRALEGPFMHPALPHSAAAPLTATGRMVERAGADLTPGPSPTGEGRSLGNASAGCCNDEIIAWAKQRADELSRTRHGPVALTSAVCQSDAARRALLRRSGFELAAASANVYWERPLDDLPVPTLADGYVVRPLAGEHEVAAYESLYNFAPVDRAHRMALLRDADYAHLVIASPDGALVAFCEVSVARQEWVPGAPRIGWIDYIGTREEHRRRGLGQAILLAGLAQLRSQGAQQAILITVPGNAPANALYASAGFTRGAYEDVYRWTR